MEKLAKRLPIRQFKLKAPVVFVTNIPTSHYKAFGHDYYESMERGLATQPNVENFQMMPNIVSNTHTIEQRAEQLADKVEKLSKKSGKRVHVLAYSFAGVDARCAASLQGMSDYCQSITTLCTPHHGMRLVDRGIGEPINYFDL